MYVGTIHGFCLEPLKTEAPEFLKHEVLDEVRQALFIACRSAESGLTTSTKLNGEPLHRYRDAGLYAQSLTVLRESHLDREALAGNSVLDGLDACRALLRAKGYLDHSAVLEKTVAALRGDAALRARTGARVKALIVDEYQNVNLIQKDLVAILHSLGAGPIVAGDDDQAIYQWRGSDVAGIPTFADRTWRCRPSASRTTSAPARASPTSRGS